MSTAVINNPILNSPFAEPSRHWALDQNGIPTGVMAEGRRRSEFIVPVPPPNEAGSSSHVRFGTTKTNFWTPRADKCPINLVVCDQDWEAAAAQALDGMPEVLRYVKNDRLGFEVPYVHGGTEHHYRPDFIVVVDDGRGPDDPLDLVLEVKGRQSPQDDAKHDTIQRLWIPAVNALGRFGRWAFVRVDGPFEVDEVIRRHLASQQPALVT